MLSTALPLLAQADDGGPGYVVAAVIASAVVLLAYLVIVAFRVRDAAARLDDLERRLDEPQAGGSRVDGHDVEARSEALPR